MKTKIILIVILLIVGFTWGQQDSSNLQEQSKVVDSLKKELLQLNAALTSEKEKNTYLKIGEDEYDTGKFAEVIIDFEKNQDVISVPSKIKKGDFYKVVIKNFNQNRYAVQINSKDSVMSKAIELPTFGGFSLDALTSLTSSFSSNATISQIIDLNNTGENYQPIELSTEDLIKRMTYSINLDSLHTDNPEIITEFLIKQEEENLKNAELILKILMSDFDALKFGIYSYRIESLRENPNYADNYDFDAALLNVRDLRNHLSSSLRKLTYAKDIFNNSISKENIKTFLESNSSYKKQIDNISAAHDAAIKKINELKELMSADNSEKLLKSILFINKQNEYKSFPIQFNGEINQLDITFTPKDSTFGLQQERVAKLIFPINEEDYWSVGTSFYYSNLSNERFSTISQINSSSDTIYTLQREDNIKREAGMALMLRFGQKINKENTLGLHGSFGPGVSIEKNVRPRILFGIGASYGKKHNIVFDWGGILGYVDRRSSAVEDGAEFFEKPDPTITKIMIGNFFSLGYMFKL